MIRRWTRMVRRVQPALQSLRRPHQVLADPMRLT
jgi:hypothetical protein